MVSPTENLPASSREVLKTGISKVMWCDPSTEYGFSEARIPEMKPEGQKDQPVFWLDQILGGGFALPTTVGSARALTILLSGPPGTGKSTLALELCHRWSAGTSGHKLPFRSLYVTSEAHEPWMRSNAESLGWNQVETHIVTDSSRWTSGNTLVIESEDSDKLKAQLAELCPPGPAGNFWSDLHQLFFPGEPALELPQGRCGVPDVLVIDSLNTLPDQDKREQLFRNFMQVVNRGPKVLIVVLNSSTSSGTTDFWEFVADVVIRLDRRYLKSDYLVRSIEIVKARYQEHAFGKHQLKTYQRTARDANDQNFSHIFQRLRDGRPLQIETLPQPAGRREGESIEQAWLNTYADHASKRMRAHPYRSMGDGGIVIFPSIHYVLSRYKRATPTKAGRPIPSAIPKLTEILHEGYPFGRCTALVGRRGGHKSHLAYVELLHRIIHAQPETRECRERALVVSLRDDEGTTRQTMEKILSDRWNVENPRQSLLRWEALGLVDVTYYPPGYITPEEFFHRLMLSINRLKATGGGCAHVTLVFNSLDQLSSRFPLCVEEQVFVPGLIQMLSGENISSFFVGAEEQNRPDYYGLQTMAELIIDFDRVSISRNDLMSYIAQSFGPHAEATKRLLEAYPDNHETVRAKVVRHAGGQPAGGSALLELAGAQSPLFSICGQKDLVVLH